MNSCHISFDANNVKECLDLSAECGHSSSFPRCLAPFDFPVSEQQTKESISSFLPPSGQLIERILLSSMLNPGEQWQTYRYHGRSFSLEYRLRFRCHSNYYGPFCNKFCRARDDFVGHFSCDQSGSKVCMEGWTGPECKIGKKRNTKESTGVSSKLCICLCVYVFLKIQYLSLPHSNINT